MNKKITQSKWLVTMILLVTAMAMPKMAWAETYDQNGFAEDGSYQPATLTTDQYDINGDGTKDEVYEIGNAGQLYWFAALVNGDQSVCTGDVIQNASANAVLTKGITVNSGVLDSDGNLNNNGSGFITWTPIGNLNLKYTGTFDGQGHTISGLYFKDSKTGFVGLFGYNSGTIKNVGVVDSYFYGDYFVGGVCGYNYKGTITGCYNTGTVSGTEYVGGVCGYNTGTITDCYNTGTVSGSSTRNDNGDYVGGVCGGNSNGGTITGCYNTGTVSGSDISYVGGVCGYNTVTITDCYNTGEVSVSSTRDDKGFYVGGVCGSNSYGTITGCYNIGSVSGNQYSQYVGGVCGFNEGGTITGCYNTGEVSGIERVGGVCGGISYAGKITGCYNIGSVSGSGDYVGGVCGHNTRTITGCYYLSGTASGGIGSIESKDVTGSGEAKTTTQFKNGEVCSLLNTALKNANASVRFYQGTNYPEFIKNLPSLVEGVYQISNKEELYVFALLVNNGETSANAVLVNDITVNTGVLTANGTLASNVSGFKVWTPIGNFDNQYKGTFDGQSHTVSGLYFKNSTDYVGLFGCIGSGGKITNVGVVDSYFNGQYHVGGVCGRNNSASISNCYSAGAVSGSFCVGGVCGYIDSASISNCYSAGAVSGISYVGGVYGISDYGNISNCYHTGAVSGRSYVGGVCGYHDRGETSNCYSAGSVSGVSSLVGGVCGYNASGTISNCYFDSKEYDKNAIGTNGGTATNVNGKTTAQFTSGEVCYLLNGSSPYGEWGQQIGTNDYPIISSAYKVLRAAQDGQEGTNYWATFSNKNSNAELMASTGEITVYNATVSGGTLTLTKRSNNKVALGEGVLLKANCEYVNAMNISDKVSAAATVENHLVATPTTAQTITAETDYTLYRLTYNKTATKEGLGFYLGIVGESKNGSQLAATPGKAYLNVSTEAATTHATAALARGFVFPGDDETTGIGEIVIEGDAGISGTANADGRIYNLQGQQVTAPVKGLYIKDNKKVIIK